MEQSPPSPQHDQPEPAPEEGELSVCGYCRHPAENLAAHMRACPAALDAARKILLGNERERVQACKDEVEQVLAKHGMRIATAPVQVSIVPV